MSKSIRKIPFPKHIGDEDTILQSIKTLVDYIKPEEARHYDECDEYSREHHIYKDIEKIEAYLIRKGVK